MKCPQCSNHLVTLEFGRIEIDYCTQCEGVWLDSGELGDLLSREKKGDSLLMTMRPAPGKEKKRKCPICLRGMKKILIGTLNPVLLDECPDHGLFFDQGELQKVLAAGGLEEVKGSSLAVFLDEIFAPGREQG